jgi:hypothetical protein
MSKLRRILNDLRGIHPKKINNERSVVQTFDHKGHKVTIFHLQDRPEDPHSYSTHFQVGGEFEKPVKLDKNKGIEILTRVHAHVNDFIKTKKPSELRFATGDPTKHKIYGKIAQKLANAHGGKVSISNDSKQGTHVIRFRKPSLFE